jgi:hypothetical protein
MDFSFRVGAVSADRSQVILEPIMKIEFFLRRAASLPSLRMNLFL